MIRGSSLVALALCLGVSATASADVVGPDKRECASGFPHQRCHGAEYCGITKCTTDAQCPSGSTCAEQKWCVWSLDCSGRYQPDGYIPSYVYGYEGSCGKGESCSEGSCQTIRACSPLPDRGCSCRLGEAAAPPGDLAGFALLALATLALVLRRRR